MNKSLIIQTLSALESCKIMAKDADGNYTRSVTPHLITKTIDALNEELAKPEYQPYVPTCACCGTTKNLHRDWGSGGPYRCDSHDCMVF